VVSPDTTLAMIPERAESRKIEKLVAILDKCAKCSRFLQNEDPIKVNMLTVRLAFDDLIEQYDAMKHHLSADSRIVHSPDFKKGVIKILKGQNKLTKQEQSALAAFKIGANSGDDSVPVAAEEDGETIEESDDTCSNKILKMAEESK